MPRTTGERSTLDERGALSDHARVRASILPVLVSLSTLACAEPAEPAAVEAAAVEPALAEPHAAASSPAAAPETPPEAPPESALEPDPEPAEPPAQAPDPDEPRPPIERPGPKPGSPEADAELAELLDESTITQAEFEAAFRDKKPEIPGDQFELGRDRPKP